MDYHGCSWDGLTRTSEWFRTPGENEDLDNFGGSSAYAAMEPSSLGKFKSYDLRKQPFNLPEPLSSWPEMNDGRVMLAYRTTSLGNLWYHLDPSGTIWYLSPFAKNFMAKISGGQGWLKKLMAEGIFAIHCSAGISGGVVFFDPGWAGWEGCGRWIHPFTIFHQTKYGERSTAPGHLTHLIEEWLIMTDLTFKDTFGYIWILIFWEMNRNETTMRETMELQQEFFPAKGFWMSRTHDPCQLISCRTTVETSWNFWWSESASKYQPQICSRTNDLWFITLW